MLSILTCEFVLRYMPNGGKAVLLRSLALTLFLYLVAIAVRSFTRDGSTFEFSLDQLLREIHDTIPWAGALFGGVYLALYSRFSSQWTYLAALYNQLMEASLRQDEENFSDENYAAWQAAFIEDAVRMHLATKEGFIGAIRMMLDDESVVEALKNDQEFGQIGLNELRLALKLEAIQ